MIRTLTALDLLFAILGGVFALFALYLVVVATAALFYRPGREGAVTRLTVVIPAHDEEASIARCVKSLRAQTYPAKLVDVVVVADNCSDDTAAVARYAGADVLVREDTTARGKGHALRFAFEQVLARTPAPDAVVVVDADSLADPHFLASLAGRLEDGAQVVQGESLLETVGTPASELRAAAFLLVNRARPSGRAVLGLPCALAGNGMAFRSDVLRAHPWSAFSATEDIEYGINLRVAGIGPVFGGGAILRSLQAPNARAAAQQQLRWEGGKLHLARTRVPRLVGRAIRERRPGLVDMAWDLALPPLGYLAAGSGGIAVVAGALAAAGVVDLWAVVPALVAVGGIPVFVLIGLRAAHAPASAYRALAGAPLFVVRKVLGTRALVRFRPDSWVRTERPGAEPDDHT